MWLSGGSMLALNDLRKARRAPDGYSRNSYREF
jgi:hypothetical protein